MHLAPGSSSTHGMRIQPLRELIRTDSAGSFHEPPKASDLIPAQKQRRGDAPPVRPYARGSADEALRIAADPNLVREAAEDLVRNAYAKGTYAAKAAHARLWVDVCEAMHVHDPFDLTPDLVICVAAVLRRAQYRSAMAHVDEAIAVYTDDGGGLTEARPRSQDGTPGVRAGARTTSPLVGLPVRPPQNAPPL